MEQHSYIFGFLRVVFDPGELKQLKHEESRKYTGHTSQLALPNTNTRTVISAYKLFRSKCAYFFLKGNASVFQT